MTDGTPKLLDFGIAKLLDPDTPGTRTVTVERMLTPAYASPEQILGETITTASDVYSLGVVLHELLAGVGPYGTRIGRPGGIEGEVTRGDPIRILDAFDSLPAVERKRIADARRTTPDMLTRSLRGDLETIVARATHRDPSRRYAGIEQFSGDVHRHLRGQIVLARPDTLTYRMGTLIRRHRALAAALVAVVLSLAAGLLATTAQYRRAENARMEAEWIAYSASLSAAEAALGADQPGEAGRQLARAPENLRGWEWRHLSGRLDRSRIALPAHEGGVTHLRFNRAGSGVWSSSLDGTLVLHDATSGQRLETLGPFGASVESFAVGSREDWVVVGLGNGLVLRCSLDGGAPDTLLRGEGWAQVALHPDEDRLAVGHFDREVRILALPGGEQVGRFEAGGGLCVPLYVEGGRRLAVGTSEGTIELRDSRTLGSLRILEGHVRRIIRMVESTDRAWIASTSLDRTVRLWHMPGGSAGTVFRGHDATTSSVLLDPGAGVAMSAAADRRLLRWDPGTGEVLARLFGHHADVYSLARSPDGRTLAAGGWDGRVLLFDWSAADVPVYRLRAPTTRRPGVEDLAVDPGGRWIACVSELGNMTLLDPGTLEELHEITAPAIRRVAVDPSGERVLLALEPRGIADLDSRTGEPGTPWSNLDVVELDAGSRGIVVACADDSLRLVSWSRQVLATVAGNGLSALVQCEEPNLVVTGHTDDRIVLRNGATLEPTQTLHAHEARVMDLVVSPSGPLVASVCAEGRALIVDAGAGRVHSTLVTDAPPLGGVAFLDRGNCVAVGGADQMIRLFTWDEGGGETLRLNGHVGRILGVVADPTHDALVTGSSDGTVRLWDTPDSDAAPKLP